MTFWWVNHNKTFSEELAGGYLWSPKFNTDGKTNFSYDNMPLTTVGDIVFSYGKTCVQAIGVVSAECIDKTKPQEIHKKAPEWNEDGWQVPVKWHKLPTPIRTIEFIEQHSKHVLANHSPFQSNGNGNQGCYLGLVTDELGKLLLNFCKSPLKAPRAQKKIYEQKLNEIELPSDALDEITSKEQLTTIRRGQAKFRSRLIKQDKCCRITGETNKHNLRASHIKPWKESNNVERLDPRNGFLLAPHIDLLFDKGFVSFSDLGDLLVADDATRKTLSRWHIALDANIGKIHPDSVGYLEYHRKNIFKK